jgi:hypothetical protein
MADDKTPDDNENNESGDTTETAVVTGGTEPPPTPKAPESPSVPSDLAARLGVEEEEHDPELDAMIRAASKDLSGIKDALGDTPWPPKKKGDSLAMVILGAIVAVFIISMFAMSGPRESFECFFDGKLRECKLSDQIRIAAEVREKEYKQRNRYGEIELFYAPQDSQVEIEVVKYVESEDQFMARIDPRQGTDSRGANEFKVVKCVLDNESLHLAEGETVPKISLKSLPVREKLYEAEDASKFVVGCVCESDSECVSGLKCKPRKVGHDVKICQPEGGVSCGGAGGAATEATEEGEKPTCENVWVASYRYHVNIKREMEVINEDGTSEKKATHDNRSFFLSVETPREGQPENSSLLKWDRRGADETLRIEWSGCDLEPKAETAMENIRKAMGDFKCELKGIKNEEEREVLIKQIQIRHGFKTSEVWNRKVAEIQAGFPEWWKETETWQKKVRCDN